jgi:hypothetical protein
VREVNHTGDASPVAQASLAAIPGADRSSYVVPQDSQQVVSGPTVQAPIRFTDYLVQHGEYTSLLSRTSVHSALVGGLDASVIEAESSGAPAAPTPIPDAPAQGQQ